MRKQCSSTLELMRTKAKYKTIPVILTLLIRIYSARGNPRHGKRHSLLGVVNRRGQKAEARVGAAERASLLPTPHAGPAFHDHPDRKSVV